jgi:hypothetical protein
MVEFDRCPYPLWTRRTLARAGSERNPQMDYLFVGGRERFARGIFSLFTNVVEGKFSEVRLYGVLRSSGPLGMSSAYSAISRNRVEKVFSEL